jgi:hypothetical protein
VLRQARRALIRSVTPFTVHGQPHLQVLYSPVGQEDTVLQARLGTEGVYPGIAVGDLAVIHAMMGIVTRIEQT